MKITDMMEEEEVFLCEQCDEVSPKNDLCIHLRAMRQEDSPTKWNMQSSDLQPTVKDNDPTLGESCATSTLISLVEARPILWDRSLSLKMRPLAMRNALWQEVAQEMGGRNSVAFLTKRWKNIRDCYLRTKADINKSGPGGSGKRQKPWKYFNALHFLKDTTIDLKHQSRHSNFEDFETVVIKTEENAKRKRNDKSLEELSNVEDEEMATSSNPPSSLSNHDNSVELKGTALYGAHIAELLELLPVRKRLKVQIDIMQLIYKHMPDSENEN